MPFKSQAQRRLFYAAAHSKKGIGGVTKKVADEFIKADMPGKLPEHKRKKKRPLYDKGE